MTTDEAVEELIRPLPRDDADRYRRMYATQPAWGLGRRPAVVVVDLQRGFVEDRYPLGNAAAAGPCLAANVELLDVARRTGLPVFFTKAMVWPNAVENGAWLRGNTMEEYGIGVGEGELDLAEVLGRRADEVVIDKPKPSAFYGTQLEAMLTYLSVDTVIVTGAGTGRCVRATVDDAFARNYRVILRWYRHLASGGAARHGSRHRGDRGPHVPIRLRRRPGGARRRGELTSSICLRAHPEVGETTTRRACSP
jgi:nicotinamidase-related amidase